jgi:hypothetical protein
MHIHLPKPLHGWREFVGEVGIIVIGVLLALGAEQAIEALHHRSQVHEMTDKLHDESVENRSPLNLDLVGLQQSQATVDTDLVALGNCGGDSHPQALVPVQQPIYLVPTDSAWAGVRDSALLPLLPEQLSDSYYKLDAIRDQTVIVATNVYAARVDATARVEAMRRGLHDRESCRDAVVQLLRLKGLQDLLLNESAGFGVFNEQALRGEVVDAVVKPGPLNLPKTSPGRH